MQAVQPHLSRIPSSLLWRASGTSSCAPGPLVNDTGSSSRIRESSSARSGLGRRECSVVH